MPRDWMDHARGREDHRDQWEERERGRAGAREDFGQADFSRDYVYDPDRRAAHRTAEDAGRRGDDYGQADYSDDYAYDPDRGRAYRRFSDEDRDHPGRVEADRGYGRRLDTGDYRRDEPREQELGERHRSWRDRAGAVFGGRETESTLRRRRGPSDRVLWAVIVERLEEERGLDLRDVEVMVENGEVTLNGTVRRKDDKRRIEDIADLEGVRNVQNNLRVREGGRRWF